MPSRPTLAASPPLAPLYRVEFELTVLALRIARTHGKATIDVKVVPTSRGGLGDGGRDPLFGEEQTQYMTCKRRVHTNMS